MSRRERREESLFWQGVIIGLVMGILGNLLVSDLMKVLEYLNSPWYVWLSSLIVAVFGILVLVWVMWVRVKKLGND